MNPSLTGCMKKVNYFDKAKESHLSSKFENCEKWVRTLFKEHRPTKEGQQINIRIPSDPHYFAGSRSKIVWQFPELTLPATTKINPKKLNKILSSPFGYFLQQKYKKLKLKSIILNRFIVKSRIQAGIIGNLAGIIGKSAWIIGKIAGIIGNLAGIIGKTAGIIGKIL